MRKFLFFPLMISIAFAQQKSAPLAQPGNTVTVYSSADRSDLKLSREADAVFATLKQPLETQVCVFVNPGKTFQTFMGIGGAITDASAEVFAKLAPAQQQELLDAYYSKTKGIGYSIIRTTIHSSDFSSGSYTYINEGDAALKSFSIDHDCLLYTSRCV